MHANSWRRPQACRSLLGCDSWTVKDILVSQSNSRTVKFTDRWRAKTAAVKQKWELCGSRSSILPRARKGGGWSEGKNTCVYCGFKQRGRETEIKREDNIQRDKLGTEQAESWSHKLPPPLLLTLLAKLQERRKPNFTHFLSTDTYTHTCLQMVNTHHLITFCSPASGRTKDTHMLWSTSWGKLSRPAGFGSV